MKLEAVADPGDPRLDDYRDVKDPRWLRQRGIFLAEGRKLVRVLLGAPGFRTRSLLATDAALESLEDALGPLAGETSVYRVSAPVMERVSGVRFHQGCVAVGERVAEPAAAELLGQLCEGRRCAVVLEDVSDPDNVGSIFRSALAFGVDAVFLGPRCAHPLYRKAIRTSMGATLQVPFSALLPWPAELERLRRAGWVLAGLTPDPEADEITRLASGADVPERVALVLGSEGFGLTPGALAQVDHRVRVPMHARADSLNVATAAAIALHRFFEAHSV